MDKDWKESKAKTQSEEYEFKTNPETLAPEKVPKQPEQSESSQPEQSEPSQEHVQENQEQEKPKPKHDVDALLDDLKRDSEKE